MSKKHGQVSVPIGTSLILVVFILLCLITFATLSYVSANADNNLSMLTADNSVEYYNADAQAQAKLMTADSVLKEAYETSSNEAEYIEYVTQNIGEDYTLSTDGDVNKLSFNVSVNEEEILYVLLDLNYDEERYSIKEWKLIYAKDWVPDEGLPVL